MAAFKHLIFYDGACPLCNRAVRFILSKDEERIFGFSSLQGQTAKDELTELFLENPKLDSMVLLQDYGKNQEKTYIEGKAVLRMFWLLGGPYALLGVLSFLPSFAFDGIYKLGAKYRYRLFKSQEKFYIPSDHLLP